MITGSGIREKHSISPFREGKALDLTVGLTEAEVFKIIRGERSRFKD
jgi:hypothetical protein